MQFIANYDVKNVFGCFENVEQHALAFSEETAVKLEYDLYYIEHANLLMDLTIILRTFGSVLGFKGR